MMRLPVAREGWPFIVAPAVVAAGLLATGHRRLAAPFTAAALAALGFFRDPERSVPRIPNAVLSAADGRVTQVTEAVDAWVGPAQRISVFLSPLDVHVNRSPIAALVAGVERTAGAFLPAYRRDADANERCTIHLAGEHARVTVVQIAGVVARRIVCRVRPGDKLEAGQRFGMIRLGSRTDVYVPRAAEVRVVPGDRVTGGTTVLGILP
jgi:phosphatidylserine decarboxylase